MNPNTIILSHATYVGASGATAAATYAFFTGDYHPPSQDRAIDTDIVVNANGNFKYVYDNGPGFKKWDPFTIKCEDTFRQFLGVNATVQKARLEEMWQHPGNLGLVAPEGTYTVHWGDSVELTFRHFPAAPGDEMAFSVQVQFEESQ